jgi:hypothetical protein
MNHYNLKCKIYIINILYTYEILGLICFTTQWEVIALTEPRELFLRSQILEQKFESTQKNIGPHYFNRGTNGNFISDLDIMFTVHHVIL